MDKQSTNQVRQVLMNDLGLTREFIREMATEIIIQTVEKETKRLDKSGRLNRVIGDELEKRFKGPLGHWDTFKSLIQNAASDQAKQFVDKRVQITAEPEPLVAPEDKKWSVLLLYPDFVKDQPETFFEHTTATTPEEAVEKVQQMVVNANGDAYDADDFHPLAIFPGHIEMEETVISIKGVEP